MISADELLRIIRELDVPAIKQFRIEYEPHLDQMSDDEALASLHVSRTQTESIHLKLRAYSHAWLTERGYPSMLPEHLKAKAQQMYPVVVEAVGIAYESRNAELNLAAPKIMRAMAGVVEDAYASDRQIRVDPDKLRGRIITAKDTTIKELFGAKPH